MRVRLFTGEKEEDGSDKLSEDIYTYRKEEIKRQFDKNKSCKDKRSKGVHNNDREILNEVDEEYKAELEELMKNN